MEPYRNRQSVRLLSILSICILILATNINPENEALKQKDIHLQITKFLNVEEVNIALDEIALSVAMALEDPAFRNYLKTKLSKLTRKDRGIFLKNLLAYQSYSSDYIQEKINSISIETKTYFPDPEKNEGILKKELFVEALSIGILNKNLNQFRKLNCNGSLQQTVGKKSVIMFIHSFMETDSSSTSTNLIY